MGVVTGLTAARMLEIEAETIIDGYVDANLRLILKRHDGTLLDIGDISAVAKLGVVDTTTLDLTLTGNGSAATPFSLKGDVRNLPASLITNGTLDPLRVPSMYATAILDPTYVGPGPARVTFTSGGGLSATYYQWFGKYEPWGNRVVTMARSGTGWVIMGHSSAEGFGGKINLSLLNGWQNYNRRQGVSDTRWSNGQAQKLVSGIVLLSGLVGYGTVTSGTVIATLPVGYRPDTDMVFPINNGDTPKAVTIQANGNIVTRGSWTSSYASLDGIAFPAAGVATWTEVGSAGSGTAFANGWAQHSSTSFGNVRFWKDPYGFVWWAGLVSGGTVTDNTAMITVPSNLVGDFPTHSKAAANDGFGFISALPGTGGGSIGYKNGTSGNGWVSLGGLAIPSVDALSSSINNWIDLTLTAGWTRYSAGFPPPQVMRRGDGMSVTRGLMKGGTAAPVKVASLPNEMLVPGEVILYSVSAALFNRVDIRTHDYSQDDDQGGYVAQSGSTAWLSWDNQMWMTGD